MKRLRELFLKPYYNKSKIDGLFQRGALEALKRSAHVHTNRWMLYLCSCGRGLLRLMWVS